jgi:EEF1A lysine methyltransferase 4
MTSISKDEEEVDNTQYKRQAYWNERFKTEDHYEWLCGFDDVMTYFTQDVPNKSASVLILGCGNSPFSAQMADAGYTNVTSVDFSSVVIAKMTDKYKESHPALKWVEADVRRLDRLFERHSFDVVVDKACLDALVCDEGDPWSPNNDTIADMEQALNSIARTTKMGGLFLSIGFQQPHFRKRYLQRRSCSFGWEQNIEVEKIDCGLGYFYTRCRKDSINHLINPVEHQDPDEDVVRIYTSVCGDMFHYGHAQLFQNSRKLGGKNVRLIVGICSDDDIISYKRAPIMTAYERGMMASQCRWVDEVVFDCPFVLTEEFVERLNIHMVTHGDDHSSASVKKYYQVALDRDIYRTVPYTQGVSTTELIERCCAQGAARVDPHGN